MTRRTGCGKVTYQSTTGLGGPAPTFDTASGALVGVGQSGDVAWGACSVSTYAYGDVNDDCAEAKTCFLCGSWNFAMAPPCN